VQKIFGLLGGKQVPIASLLGAAGILEFVGVLLIAGLLTRPVAAVLIVEMLVAYVSASAARLGADPERWRAGAPFRAGVRVSRRPRRRRVQPRRVARRPARRSMTRIDAVRRRWAA
jgi:hypothetical protein